MVNDIVKATASDAGCWIDGHWGWLGTAYVVEIAEAHGFPLSVEDRTALDAYQSTDGINVPAGEYVIGQGGLCDKAEEWMNANVAPEGFSFGWHDGEFFLWSAESWEEV